MVQWGNLRLPSQLGMMLVIVCVCVCVGEVIVAKHLEPKNPSVAGATVVVISMKLIRGYPDLNHVQILPKLFDGSIGSTAICLQQLTLIRKRVFESLTKTKLQVLQRKQQSNASGVQLKSNWEATRGSEPIARFEYRFSNLFD